MNPKQNNYYLSKESDGVRILYLTSVVEEKDYERNEKLFHIEGMLLLGFFHNKMYVWWERTSPTNDDIDALEREGTNSSIKLVPVSKYKNLLQSVFEERNCIL